MRKHSFLILLTFVVSLGMTYAQPESSSIERQMLLDSVVVHGHMYGDRLRMASGGNFLWDMRMMDDLPKILGNADPLHYAQMLPGVSTNGEYDAGFRVAGNENCHNYMSINGVPLFGTTHILGLFSVFNAAHFNRMSLQKSMANGASSDRLGATVDMQTHRLRPDSVTGEFAIGVISSQSTIRIPVSKRSHLTASLRASYLNWLYSSFLDGDDTSTKYSFYDANLNYYHDIDDCNSLCFDLYFGNDDATVMDKESDIAMSLKWGNGMVALRWSNDNGSMRLSNSMYFTRSGSDGKYNAKGVDVVLPSSISEYGNKFSMETKGWTFGLDASFYRIHPQSPDAVTSYAHIRHHIDITHTAAVAAYADKSLSLTKGLTLNSGVRLSVYHSHSDNFHNISPAVGISYQHSSGWDFTLGYSLRHQYLVQTGLSTINTPMEFWVSCGMYGLRPQSSHSFTLTGRYVTANGRYSITAEAYNRLLSNQVEYNGTPYSYLAASDYDLQDMLLIGKGHNYGANIILSKNSGFVTGWVCYAFGRAWRIYDTAFLNGTFPASHERKHEVNAIVVFHPAKRIDIGITGVWGSGTPFTAPEYYYILQNRLIPNFAGHNSNRLRPYCRVDVSANYRFSGSRIKEHGLNISVYNITGYKNDLFYYMKANRYFYQYKSMRFALRVLPSVSYYMKF